MKCKASVRNFGSVFVCIATIAWNPAVAENWPGWRGPWGDGTSLEKNVPTQWDATQNVLWKTPLPGAGHASPIVWGDRIFTVSAAGETQERMLICVDRKTGVILWTQTVLRAPLETKNPENSYATSTPATDGEKVYATFLDVNDIVVGAYDFSGKRVWQVRLGVPFEGPHGFCGSPVLYKDKIIVNIGNRGDSCVVAVSQADGHRLWKIPQPYRTLSFSTPLIKEMAGRTQMITCGDKSVAAYSPDDGSLLWTIDGPSEEFVASPAYSERARLAFISSGYPQRHLLAIRPDGSGNVTQTHVAWRTTQGAPYVPSPIVVGDYLLTANNISNQASCYEAATGNILWAESLGRHHASPVAADGLVYFLSDDGVTNVVKPGPQFERVAQNPINEKTYASPAISEGQIFIRGEKNLFCIARAAVITLPVTVEVGTDAGKLTLFLIGDSTVKTGRGTGENGQWGWGSFIGELFDKSRIDVENHALGGTSSRTFQTLGSWEKVLALIKPGDYVMMQFGHNDGGPLDDNRRARGTIPGIGDESRQIDNPLTGKKEIVHTYGWYMRKYIADTKAKGATPIVLSMIPRNSWTADGKVNRVSDTYGKWAAEAAAAGGAFFINLNEITAKQYEAIGREKVAAEYFTSADNTHTSEAGSRLNAASVVQGLKELKDCALAGFLAATAKPTGAGERAGAADSGQKPAFLQWASRPPMGWNSWDCFATTVTEEQTKAQADYMAEHLARYGWQYIVVDIQWYEPQARGYNYRRGAELVMDESGRLWPATNRFPSSANGVGFKALADYVHGKGLKFGIHLLRGIPRQAVNQNTPVKGTNLRAADIADKESICPWNTDMYGVDMTKPGAQEYYNSVYELVASWNVDFVKVDDISRPYNQHSAEIEAIRKAIDNSARPMVLSLSPGETPLDAAEHVIRHANMWRISDDFWDNWPALLEQFERCRKWAPYIGPGHFPDADMLPFGVLDMGRRKSRFTPDEQYTVMTLWAIFRSPLMHGGDMTKMDDFTLSLLTNEEVIAVDQESSGNHQLFNQDGLIAWVADVPNSADRYLALFNTKTKGPEAGDATGMKIAVKLVDLGFIGPCRIRDLWKKETIREFKVEFAPETNWHGAGLYRVSQVKP